MLQHPIPSQENDFISRHMFSSSASTSLDSRNGCDDHAAAVPPDSRARDNTVVVLKLAYQRSDDACFTDVDRRVDAGGSGSAGTSRTSSPDGGSSLDAEAVAEDATDHAAADTAAAAPAEESSVSATSLVMPLPGPVVRNRVSPPGGGVPRPRPSSRRGSAPAAPWAMTGGLLLSYLWHPLQVSQILLWRQPLWLGKVCYMAESVIRDLNM